MFGRRRRDRSVLQQMRIDELVSRLVQENGSDLHLKVGAPPAVRVRGLLAYLEGYEVMRPVDTEELLKEIIPEKMVEEFETDGEASHRTVSVESAEVSEQTAPPPPGPNTYRACWSPAGTRCNRADPIGLSAAFVPV